MMQTFIFCLLFTIIAKFVFKHTNGKSILGLKKLMIFDQPKTNIRNVKKVDFELRETKSIALLF